MLADQYSPVECSRPPDQAAIIPIGQPSERVPLSKKMARPAIPHGRAESFVVTTPHLVARKARVQVPADANGSVTFEDAPRPTLDMRGWKPAGGLEL